MLSARLAVVCGILLFAIGCGSSYSSGTPSPTPSPSPSPSPAPDGGGASSAVTIPMGAATLGNQAFAPDGLNVAVGTTVTWKNTDSVAHTSTSDAQGWDSGVVNPGGQFSTSFSTAGTYRYHCAIHPGMIGTVVVH
jgi:plastocyanin